MHIIFHFLWDHWAKCGIFENAHIHARGRKQRCRLHECLWRVSIKPRLPFSNPKCVFLFPKAIFLTFIILHCSWCKCRVAVVERLPVLHHSADYISLLLSSFEIKPYCKLHGCLWRVSIKPRLPFSYQKCVLCFERQSFWRLLERKRRRKEHTAVYFKSTVILEWDLAPWKQLKKDAGIKTDARCLISESFRFSYNP